MEHPRGEILPALGLVQRVILPGSRCCVALVTASAFGAVREATRGCGALAVFSAPAQETSDPLSAVGVLAHVIELRKGQGLWTAELEGTHRVRRHELLRTHPFRLARVEPWPDGAEDRDEVAPLAAAVRAAVAGWPGGCGLVRDRVRSTPSGYLAGAVMPLLEQVPWTEWQDILEGDTVGGRLAFVLAHLRQGTALAC
jgi:Lon protease-like protein